MITKKHILSLIAIFIAFLSFGQERAFPLGNYTIGQSTFTDFKKSLGKQKLKLKIISDNNETESNSKQTKVFLFSTRKENVKYRTPPFGPPYNSRVKCVILLNYMIKNVVFDKIEMYFFDDTLSSVKGEKRGYFSEAFLNLDKTMDEINKVNEPKKTVCNNLSVELKNIIIRFSNQYEKGNYYLYETINNECKPVNNCQFSVENSSRIRRISALEINGLESDKTIERKDSYKN
ncbi:hypothetical protein N4T20_09205 [Flavobacterium sp. TR2]|uniref:hypothetical protein n=1 Tax=Flavobacterium sp. TR2 TaxID=2977321 RepID=UPI0021B106E5|nr:hypothetical protein [Flavobacterium sp. TR2]UWY30105.1 hypothetical protein N4T20_09205 [Flavobacterium sp. TR2]